jgi:hypothetical protein
MGEGSWGFLPGRQRLLTWEALDGAIWDVPPAMVDYLRKFLDDDNDSREVAKG